MIIIIKWSNKTAEIFFHRIITFTSVECTHIDAHHLTHPISNIQKYMIIKLTKCTRCGWKWKMCRWRKSIKFLLCVTNKYMYPLYANAVTIAIKIKLLMNEVHVCIKCGSSMSQIRHLLLLYIPYRITFKTCALIKISLNNEKEKSRRQQQHMHRMPTNNENVDRGKTKINKNNQPIHYIRNRRCDVRRPTHN